MAKRTGGNTAKQIIQWEWDSDIGLDFFDKTIYVPMRK
jgi:hypothetical protein